jgi:putative aminopeptidase FrvX
VELVKKLCNAYGPAGREDNIRKIIASEISGLCDSVETDRLGNLIAYVPAVSKGSKTISKRKPKIMFCAHMDEIGMIVTYIDKKGFLRFTNVGHLWVEYLISRRIVFENGTTGIIGVERKPETPKPPDIDNLFIDINAKGKEETKGKVDVGDIAAFQQQAMIVDKHIISKALDDRIGCYCLVEAMKRLKNNPCDLYFVFTVQEEVGLRGARTGAYGIMPDFAIAVDITLTGDTPESRKMAVSLGAGTAIKIKDQIFLADPRVKDKLVTFCEEAKIPYQLEILEKGTTDAAVVQLVREGISSGVLSIPARYVHSANEICDLDDVENTIRLIVEVCKRGLA